MKTAYKKLRLSPSLYLTPSVHTTALCMIFALLPQLILLAITGSYRALLLIVACCLASTSVSVANALAKKRLINASSVIIPILQGILIAMFLPETYPVLQAFFVVACSLAIIECFFGGFSACFANPIAVTIALAWFVGSSFFPQNLITLDTLSSGNVQSALFSSDSMALHAIDVETASNLNTSFLRHLGIALPQGYVSLFWDSASVIPAFRFNVLTLLASIFLLSIKMIDYLVPAIFLVVYALLVRFFGFSVAGFAHFAGEGDMIFALLTSGTLFTAFFVLCWYGTQPVSKLGKIIYGAFAGTLAFLVMGPGASPVGAVFVVLGANLVSPIIQLIESKCYLLFTYPVLKVKVEDER